MHHHLLIYEVNILPFVAIHYTPYLTAKAGLKTYIYVINDALHKP